MIRLLDILLTVTLFWAPGGEARALRGLERAVVSAPWQESRYEPTPGSHAAKTLAAFEHFLQTEHHVTIRYLPAAQIRPQADAAGRLLPTGPAIYVEDELLANGRLEVLAHEAAHLFQPALRDMPESEVFAEAVSYLVCRRLGLNTKRQAAQYLARYKSALPVLRYYRGDVYRAVASLTRWR